MKHQNSINSGSPLSQLNKLAPRSVGNGLRGGVLLRACACVLILSSSILHAVETKWSLTKALDPFIAPASAGSAVFADSNGAFWKLFGTTLQNKTVPAMWVTLPSDGGIYYRLTDWSVSCTDVHGSTDGYYLQAASANSVAGVLFVAPESGNYTISGSAYFTTGSSVASNLEVGVVRGALYLPLQNLTGSSSSMLSNFGGLAALSNVYLAKGDQLTFMTACSNGNFQRWWLADHNGDGASPLIESNALTITLNKTNTVQYLLNEQSGVSAYDNSGSGLTATLYNFSTPQGWKGGSLLFDGVNDYIESPVFSTPSRAISVACWAKSTGSNWNASAAMVSKRNSFILHTYSGLKTIGFYIFINGTWRFADFVPQIDLTQWHHYAGTYDGQFIRLFIDGQLVSQTSASGLVAADPTGRMYIGRDDGYDSFFGGSIKDVRVSPYAFDSADVFEIYNQVRFDLQPDRKKVIVDSSANLLTTNVSGATVETTAGSDSVGFNGAGSVVTLSKSENAHFDEGMTICANVRFDDSPASAYDTILYKRNEYILANAFGGQIYFNFVDSLTGNWIPGGITGGWSTGDTIKSGVWQHVAVTVKNDGDLNYTVKIYVDGNLWGSKTVSGVKPAVNTNPVIIGRADNWSNQWDFRGGLRRLQLYSRVLTSVEIAEAGGRIGTQVIPPSSPAWRGNTIGVLPANEVPPPWTPLTWSAPSDYEAGCSGRTIVYDRSAPGPLPKQILSNGTGLLSGPITFVGTTGTSETAWVPTELNVPVANITANQIPFFGRGILGTNANNIVVSGRIEYDGMIWFEVDADMRSTSCDRLEFVVPLKNTVASYRLLPNYSKNCVKSNSDVTTTSEIGREDLPYWTGAVENHYLWFGNEDVGLAWFQESANDWPGNAAKRVALRRESDGNYSLRVRLMESGAAGKRMTFRFGLQATPTKPRPQNWRRLANSGLKYLWASPDYELFHGYPAMGTNPGAVADFVGNNHSTGVSVSKYMHNCMISTDLACNEWKWYARDWFAPSRFYDVGTEAASKEVLGVCPNSSDWRDFLVYNANRYLRDYDVDGIYHDFSPPQECDNYRHGCSTGFMPILATRELSQRLYLMQKNLATERGTGRRGLYVMHTSINTGGLCIPITTFADAIADNEQVAYYDDYVREIPLEYLRIRGSAKPFGFWSDFIMTGYGTAPTRGILGMCLLHDIHAYWNRQWPDGSGGYGPAIRADLAALDRRFGLYEANVEFLPYWKPMWIWLENAPGSGNLIISAYRRLNPSNPSDNRCIAIVMNRGYSTERASVCFGRAGLGLAESATIADLRNEPFVSTGSYWATVDIPPGDFRILSLSNSPLPE